MASPISERATLTWEEVRALYPSAADVAYLDSAAVGVGSTRVWDAMTAVLTQHQRLGIAAAPSWREHAGHSRFRSIAIASGRSSASAPAHRRAQTK
jgi:hypothetical protein